MIKSFRLISHLEGISYLLILFVTMPLKYVFDSPEPNRYIGMAHGFLFIIYIVLAFLIKPKKQWSIPVLGIVLVCSIIPFGTFWADHKYLAKN